MNKSTEVYQGWVLMWINPLVRYKKRYVLITPDYFYLSKNGVVSAKKPNLGKAKKFSVNQIVVDSSQNKNVIISTLKNKIRFQFPNLHEKRIFLKALEKAKLINLKMIYNMEEVDEQSQRSSVLATLNSLITLVTRINTHSGLLFKDQKDYFCELEEIKKKNSLNIPSFEESHSSSQFQSRKNSNSTIVDQGSLNSIKESKPQETSNSSSDNKSLKYLLRKNSKIKLSRQDLGKKVERLIKQKSLKKLTKKKLKTEKFDKEKIEIANSEEKSSISSETSIYLSTYDNFLNPQNKIDHMIFRAKLIEIMVSDLESLGKDLQRKLLKIFAEEKIRISNLENIIETIGKEQARFEQKILRSSLLEKNSSFDGVFYDADSILYFNPREKNINSTVSESFVDKLLEKKGSFLSVATEKKKRRKEIPEKKFGNISLWSLLKNNIGRDITKIVFPVTFSEPISFLQRLTEDLEYSCCLDKASSIEDQWERMAHVAAFTISVYSNSIDRFAKPFNPIEGETYECDRVADMGWRSLAEQIKHRPPLAVIYAEGKKWNFWQQYGVDVKFKGTSLVISPLGQSRLNIFSWNDLFTWTKVPSVINNIIVGSLWVDYMGEVELVNHRTGDKGIIKYHPYSILERGIQKKISGTIYDRYNKLKYVLSGSWGSKVEGHSIKITNNEKNSFEILDSNQLWKKTLPPPQLIKCYNFTEFTVSLNEMEKGVAPSDSRLRPDLRLMEEGNWEEADVLKLKIEEKQREIRARREMENKEHKPSWFEKYLDPISNEEVWNYNGNYWKEKSKKKWNGEKTIFIYDQ